MLDGDHDLRMEATTGQPSQLNREKLAREAQERSNMYGFLAAVYRAEPTPELLRQIRTPPFFGAISGAGVTLGEDFLNLSEDQLISELSLEYTRLFVGPGKHVSPYASVHASSGSLWGEPASAMQRIVESAGLTFSTDYHGMPDHICVELEFMQQVTGAESRGWLPQGNGNAADCLYAENEFLNKHLAAWVPAFCDKVVKTAELRFYKEMAALTVGFVQSEQEGVEQLIRQLPSTERH